MSLILPSPRLDVAHGTTLAHVASLRRLGVVGLPFAGGLPEDSVQVAAAIQSTKDAKRGFSQSEFPL